SGTLAGEQMAPGLIDCARLEPPIFSPATKAEAGHDENITFEQAIETVGVVAAEELRRASLLLYERGRSIAEPRGIIIADTKFEFGRDDAGIVRVIDEILTPDSSRFWPADRYEAGRNQPSFDKQPVRDYLEGLAADGKWDKQPPPPDLPEIQIEETSARYQEAFRRLTGVALDDVDLGSWGTG
ncbi:MAG TPA: phosphoribosylaminoimidazolesuccinocarboxamide synthase, partial [Longimicrobiaceae bacterium]|nr:phosphoribosylaminoimidazolesuccinocarboxamide synthase [Longimicrobiaceae bacterium]